MDMNSCFYCDKNPFYVLDQRPVCARCFKEHAEKKLKKHLRGYGIKAHSHVSIASPLVKSVLSRILGGLPLTIKESGEVDHIITQETLDDHCCRFLGNLFFGDLKDVQDTKIINLFKPLSDSDVGVYAKILGFPFTPQSKPKETQELLKTLTSFFPHVRNNLLKTSQELEACISKEKSPSSP